MHGSNSANISPWDGVGDGRGSLASETCPATDHRRLDDPYKIYRMLIHGMPDGGKERGWVGDG